MAFDFAGGSAMTLTKVAEDFSDRPDCDVHSSSEKYAQRFPGELGKYFLDRQWELVSAGIPQDRPLKILDVGGGHAQVVERLAGGPHSITVVGSENVCAERLKSWLSKGQCKFEIGNFYDLPFADKSFDLVVSLRQTAHIANHQQFINELCRVSRERVIIDYAPYCSFNILYPLLFWLKKYIEKGTRLFLIHSCADISRCFRSSGFILYSKQSQFLWPMGLHRAVNNVLFSRFLEGLMQRLGLTRLFGSPTIVVMVASLV